ncbi:hypothetical protein PFICI_01432 [Pestalotiopsis fici W106-1]|uniref:BZIP domain-containing protein n=1 Tax=Pestalotiopsis fici (strain W106-1 / CGMCC3.15140) TaxID=1229662 RepID=W3XNP9_PESFW|nr:uncharacterized protein PFICI_01432 [Pestalotiopsis fici W106-1]ETS87604.1 hypothetical protein PFICI_01432 [Pestalotiopsis fici W106-1]
MDSQDKGALGSLNLGFLKTLTEKKTTRDGLTPKRRGPKPDSKPALTRRQELNRQAQRTHRERKELYIKALEDEVLRLKEVFSNVTQDKDKLAEENRQLKLLLAQNGSIGNLDDMTSTPSLGYNTSSPSVSGTSGSYAPASSATTYTPPMTSQSSNAPPATATSQMMPTQQHGVPQQSQHSRSLSQQQRVDYEQAGIDFVLSYENPDHSTKTYTSSPPH